MLSAKAALTIAAGISAFLTALVGVQDWVRPVERAQLRNARRLRQQAVGILDELDGMNSVRELKLRVIARTYPYWSIADSQLFGRRGGVQLKLRGAQIHLNILRKGALLPQIEMWMPPYERKLVLAAYDDVIAVLRDNVLDSNRVGRSVVGLRIIGLCVTLVLGICAALV